MQPLNDMIAEDRRQGYRPGVAMLLIHHGQVLLARKAGGYGMLNLMTEPDFEWPRPYAYAWEIPQGGIENGETVADAFFREAEEELHMKQWMYGFSEPEFLHREQRDFRTEKDGTVYRGKTYYYMVAKIGLVSDLYDLLVYGPNGDDGPTPFPVGEYYGGGVIFCNYMEAQDRFQRTHQGKKTSQSLKILHDLKSRGLLCSEGGRLSSYSDLDYLRSLPLGDPCSLQNREMAEPGWTFK